LETGLEITPDLSPSRRSLDAATTSIRATV
jgi:hypothetical protein